MAWEMFWTLCVQVLIGTLVVVVSVNLARNLLACAGRDAAPPDDEEAADE